jgi:hypothetical protein
MRKQRMLVASLWTARNAISKPEGVTKAQRAGEGILTAHQEDAPWRRETRPPKDMILSSAKEGDHILEGTLRGMRTS